MSPATTAPAPVSAALTHDFNDTLRSTCSNRCVITRLRERDTAQHVELSTALTLASKTIGDVYDEAAVVTRTALLDSDRFPVASAACTVNVYEVAAFKPVTVKDLRVANPTKLPLLKMLYPYTATSSDEDVHASLTVVELLPVEDSFGAEGAVTSGGAELPFLCATCSR